MTCESSNILEYRRSILKMLADRFKGSIRVNNYLFEKKYGFLEKEIPDWMVEDIISSATLNKGENEKTLDDEYISTIGKRDFFWRYKKCEELPKIHKVYERMKELNKMEIDEYFNVFKQHWKLSQGASISEEEKQVTILKWEELGRRSKIIIIVSYFFEKPIEIRKRVQEKVYVEESEEELKNIFLTMNFPNGKTFHIHQDIFLEILPFLIYDRHLLNNLGGVNKDIYLLILMSWRSIEVTPANVYKISLLVMRNVHRISFTKKACNALSRKEISYVWDHAKKLREIDLERSEGALEKLLSSNNHVKLSCQEIKLPLYKHTKNFLSAKKLSLNNFPNIHTLHISYFLLMGISKREGCKKISSIRTLHLGIPCYQDFDPNISVLSNICELGNLTKITIIQDRWRRSEMRLNQFYFNLFEHLPHLEDISFRIIHHTYDFSLGSFNFIQPFEKAKYLKKFEFHVYQNQTDHIASLPLLKFPKLLNPSTVEHFSLIICCPIDWRWRGGRSKLNRIEKIDLYHQIVCEIIRGWKPFPKFFQMAVAHHNHIPEIVCSCLSNLNVVNDFDVYKLVSNDKTRLDHKRLFGIRYDSKRGELVYDFQSPVRPEFGFIDEDYEIVSKMILVSDKVNSIKISGFEYLKDGKGESVTTFGRMVPEGFALDEISSDGQNKVFILLKNSK